MHKCSRKILVLRNKAVLATTGNELIGTLRLNDYGCSWLLLFEDGLASCIRE